jgi:CubicO group peptidase (beta-lactamase class C family)
MRELHDHPITMKTILSFLFFIIIGFAFGQANKPPNLKDGITTAFLSQVGINEALIKEVETQITSGYYPNIHSLLIYKADKLVYENYFKGKDEIWGTDLGVIEHKIDDLHDVRSISKSVVSACIGIAVAQGKIKNVDQRVFEFFPEYAAYDTGMIRQLTIKHLLTMTSGLKWNEEVPYDNPENSEIQMIRSPDPIAFVLSRPFTISPGKEWKYNGGTTQLLAAIIERTTGKKVDAFADEFLFRPLGITKFEWIKYSGSDNPAAASGLRLRSRDLLKFGILYHRKGKWNNKQIVPQAWIEESFTSWVSQSKRSGDYGFQFWIWNEMVQGRSIKLVAAVGNGDQRIFFDETNDLLVVVTAGNYNKWDITNNSSAILRKIYESFSIK